MKKPVFLSGLIAMLFAMAAFAGQFEIIKAVYTGGDVHRDVTSLLAEKVKEGNLQFQVGNGALGGDPCFGKVKELAVVYRTEGGDFNITAREGERLVLPDARNVAIAPALSLPDNLSPASSTTALPAAATQNSSSNQALLPAASVPVPQITLPLTGQEFTTLDGDKYTNATVKRVEPDGIVVTDGEGIRKLKFKNLPPEVGQKFGYDPTKAAQFQATIQASAIVAQQQADQLHKTELVAQQAEQNQKVALTAKQSSEEQDDRFTAWTQELAKQKELLPEKWYYAQNAHNPDPFSLTHNSAREQGAREAKALESRITAFASRFATLRKLVSVLDQAHVKLETTQHLIDAVRDEKVFIGMPSSFVLLSWGEPSKVNRTSTAHGSSEQWVYRRGGGIEASFVYIEGGVATTIQN